MAFVGHPILADIRKGFHLRPTQTVDKSKPIIQAEGEQMPELLQNRSPSPALSPQREGNRMPKGTTAQPMIHQQRNETKRQHENKTTKPSPPKSIGCQPVSADQRQKMLAQIRAGGVRLRHVQTVDKSGLIIDEQQQNCTNGTRNDTASPHSLDSQGKSPSPRTTPSSSSASAFSPTPISAGDSGGGCWHRTLSDDSSDSVPLMMNGCVPVAPHHYHHQQHNGRSNDHFEHPSQPPNYPPNYLPNYHHHNHHCSDNYSNHRHDHNDHQQSLLSPEYFLNVPSSVTVPTSSNLAIGRVPSPLPAKWNQSQGTTVIRVGGTPLGGNIRIDQPKQPKGKSDFQFDDQKQILERREEVASLCAQRSMSAKLVTFRKLQQQQTESIPSSYCTLPRKAKAQTPHKHWHAKVASSESSAETRPLARAHCAETALAVGKKERHGANGRRERSPADWHGTKLPQASTATKNEQNANTLPNSKLRWHSPSPRRRNDDAPPLLHRSASSSVEHFALAEQPAPFKPSANFRPFGQRMPGGGAHRQHFERIRDRFEDAEKRKGGERSAEVLWKRAAEERKGAGEKEESAKMETKGGVATVFVNGVHHLAQGQPPPLPNSSPPEIRPHKTRPFAASPSPCPSREIIRLKTPTNGIDLRDLQNLDGAQLALLRMDFKFAIDLDDDAEGKRLIRIVKR